MHRDQRALSTFAFKAKRNQKDVYKSLCWIRGTSHFSIRRKKYNLGQQVLLQKAVICLLIYVFSTYCEDMSIASTHQGEMSIFLGFLNIYLSDYRPQSYRPGISPQPDMNCLRKALSSQNKCSSIMVDRPYNSINEFCSGVAVSSSFLRP